MDIFNNENISKDKKIIKKYFPESIIKVTNFQNTTTKDHCVHWIISTDDSEKFMIKVDRLSQFSYRFIAPDNLIKSYMHKTNTDPSAIPPPSLIMYSDMATGLHHIKNLLEAL